jgi:hypothetical protein
MGFADDIAGKMKGPLKEGAAGEEQAEPAAEASDEEMKGRAIREALEAKDDGALYEAIMACK